MPAALAVSLFWMSGAVAQILPQAEGVKGWRAALPHREPEYFATPMQACKRLHEFWEPRATFYGYQDSPQYWWSKSCDWCLHNAAGDLCLFTTGAPTQFICETGYVWAYPGSCVKADDPREQVRACSGSGGHPNPATPNPILILTGAKLLSATDFASPDGDLALERLYRSMGGKAYVLRPPWGLGLGWRLSFQHELAIDDDFQYTGRVTLHTADGGAYDFVRQSSGAMAPAYTSSQNAVRNADYRLAFEGAWPSDLAQVRRMKTFWRLTDPDGRSWRFESFNQPGLTTAFDVARPASMTRRDGYGQTFAYGPRSELQTLTDSFGRSLTFTWHYATSYPNGTLVTYPVALASATLPSGTTLHYAYESLSGADPLARPERLKRVEQRDTAGAVLESTTYHHEDARFPAYVTGITDARGVRTLTVAYDSRGRAVSSEKADGAERVMVAYGEAATPFTTRTVTNPLGKQAVYRYRATGSGAFRLEQVEGVASTNCPASARSYAYDANGWVTSETDEEGRRTVYGARNARGLPASVTRGAP